MDFDKETGIYSITQPSDESSSNKRGVLKNAKSAGKSLLAASLVCWLIILVIAIISAVPLTQLIIGSLHRNDCPINHRIPIYLIVSGTVGLFLALTSICQNASEGGIYCICLNLILGLFSFAWFIAGSVWVFQAKSIVQFSNPDQMNTYCHRTVFNCAYITIIIIYVLGGIGGCCGCITKSAR